MPLIRWFPMLGQLRWQLIGLVAVMLFLIILVMGLAFERYVEDVEVTSRENYQSSAVENNARALDLALLNTYRPLLLLGAQTPAQQQQQISHLLDPSRLQRFYEVLEVSAEGQVLQAYGDTTLSDQFNASPPDWWADASNTMQYFGGIRGLETEQLYLLVGIQSSNDTYWLGRAAIGILQQVVNGARLGETGFTYLVDQNQTILLHRNTDLIGRNLNDLETLNIIIAQSPRQWQGEYNDFTGVSVYGSSYPLQQAPWTMVVEQDYNELNFGSRNLGRLLILLAGVGVVALLLFSLIVVRSLLRPLQALQVGANSIAQGRLEYQIPFEGRGEIAKVAQAFNQMSQQLQLSFAQLKTQNALLLQTNQDLALARQQAEESARLKSEFLSTMSHELRTPLNAIMGYSELLAMGAAGDLNEQQKGYQEIIQANAGALLGMINQMLEVSRLEAGRLALELNAFDPHQLLGDLSAYAEALCAPKGLTFHSQIDSAFPPQLWGDYERLRQIAAQLLSNAVKFTAEGHVHLEFNLPSTGHWAIVVNDSGVGIPPDQIPIIFDEFRQADGGYSRTYGGTGLGLALVKKLTDLMGGSVTVESQEGQGSTFRVTLPLQLPPTAS